MHRARIRGPRLHPAHRLRPFFISSLLMSNILQRDLPLALISQHVSFGSPRIETLPLREVDRRDHGGSQVYRRWNSGGAIFQALLRMREYIG